MASGRAYRQGFGVSPKHLIILCGISLIGGAIGAVILLFNSAAIFDHLLPSLLLVTLVFLLGKTL